MAKWYCQACMRKARYLIAPAGIAIGGGVGGGEPVTSDGPAKRGMGPIRAATCAHAVRSNATPTAPSNRRPADPTMERINGLR